MTATWSTSTSSSAPTLPSSSPCRGSGEAPEPLEHAVATLEAGGDRQRGERRRDDGQREHAGGEHVDRGVGEVEAEAVGAGDAADQREHGDHQGEQQLLAVAQQQPRLHRRLGDDLAGQRCRAGSGGEVEAGAGRGVRVAPALVVGHAPLRVVRARKTSSRVRPSAVSSAGVPEATSAAAVEDVDDVGEPLGLVHVVGGEHDGDAGAAQLAQELPGRPAGVGVHARGGLVDEDELGSADDRHGQAEPLLLAPGEAAVRRPAALLQPEPLARARRGRAGGRAAGRCAAASRRRGRPTTRRPPGASRRSGGAGPAGRGGGRARARARCRPARGGSPRRSRAWSSCRRRWVPGRR